MTTIEVRNLNLAYPVKHKARMVDLVNRARSKKDSANRFNDGARGYEFVALEQISFSVDAGTRLALIGANGSGKTTLLKVLHGIFRPTSGTVRVEGRTDALFNVGLGFRMEATGRRNVELRGLINGWSEKDIAERMEEIIAYSELGEFIDMPYKTYSQGMAARLAFAIATAFEPEILLMDEWIGAGDPTFQEKARDRMSKLIDAAGIVVVASHNAAILRRICNRGVVLDRGRLVFMGELEDALSFSNGETKGRRSP